MSGRKHCKRWISTMALTATVWSGAAGAVPSAFAAASPFSDVVQGHWAEKHVTKLALQGIISGKGQGKFDPSGSITREDAVIIALRFMGLADEIDTTQAIAFPSTFELKDYAKPYVMEAFKRKLLLTDEEYAIANAGKGKSWGETPASREWVARLLVRAIGKEAEARANVGKATSFADDGLMDAAYRPYVLTAVNEGLVAGVTPTTFEPKLPINRASIATLFSKAESKLGSIAYSGQVSGVLMSVQADKLTLLLDDGSTHDYTLTPQTLYARYDSDKPMDAAALKPYTRMILIHDANGAIGYAEQTDDKSYVTTVDGTFTQWSASRSSVYLWNEVEMKEYFYDKEPKVTDASGNAIGLKDIPANARISMTVDTVRTSPRIIAISVNQSLVNKTATGTVVFWDSAKGELQVSDPSTGSTEKWTVLPQAVFKLGDVPVTRETMKAGDSITYEVKAGSVVSVTIAKPLVTQLAGTLYDVNKDKKIITFYQDGQITSKLLADVPKVLIQGMTDAGLDDLQKDDSITLSLDAHDQVTQIAVNNRSVKYLTGATIKAYLADSDINQLTLIDAAGEKYNLDLDSGVRFDLNGYPIDAAQAKSRLTVGKKITVAYSGEKAITIYFIGKYDGTVVENNTVSKKLTIRVDASNTVTLPYSYPFVEISGQSSASFTDVKAGDRVSVTLNDNQDQITSIMVQKSGQYEVVSADLLNSKIRLKKQGASTYEDFSVPTTAVLQDENGTAMSLSKLSPGSTANVTLSGKTTLVKLKVVPTVYGKVVSVNPAANTLDIGLANGTTVTRTADANPIVLKDSVTYSSLSVIQPNDRVEFRKDESDRTVIEVITPLRKEFWQYNSSNDTFKVKVSGAGNENNVFALDAKAYIHSGTSVLTMYQLLNGDKISIYVLRGKAVEIEK